MSHPSTLLDSNLVPLPSQPLRGQHQPECTLSLMTLTAVDQKRLRQNHPIPGNNFRKVPQLKSTFVRPDPYLLSCPVRKNSLFTTSFSICSTNRLIRRSTMAASLLIRQSDGQ